MAFLRDKLDQLQAYQQKGRPVAPLDTAKDDYPVCICQNCSTEFRGNYCPQCGQQSDTKRINLRTAIEHALGIFTNMDRGFMRTCTELCYRPGYMIRDYLNGHRASYSKPLSLLFVLATVHFVVHYIFYQTSEAVSWNSDMEIDDGGNEALIQFLAMLRSVFEYLSANQAVVTLITILFLTIPNWMLFKLTRYGKRLNLAEHFYIMLFIGCQLMMVNILRIPYDRFFNYDNSFFVFGSGLSFLIMAWDFKQMFQIGWIKSIVLYAVSHILALLLFIITLVLLLCFYFLVWHPETQSVLQEIGK